MRRVVLLILALLGVVRPVFAGDGTWTQFDVWNGGSQLAMNVEKGRIVWGLGVGNDDGEPWLRASALYTWQLGDERAPWKLRAGSAIKAEQIGWWELEDHSRAYCFDAEGEDCASLEAGVRLSADRWAEYGRWGTFLMADYTSTDNASLLVGGVTHLSTRLGAQVSVWNEDDGDVTPTMLFSAPVTKRLSARFGHKFVEDETFIGFSFSTY